MYVFILCPPFSGSTLLWKLISTSTAVSIHPREGQALPETKKIFRDHKWNADAELPWKEIKSIWEGYWNHDKPLLIEKSPPHIIRADDIARHFQPSSFIVMVRNPYAHCEGLMRRNHAQTGANAHKAAEFTIRCLKQQAENSRKLRNVLSFTYEELVASPKSVCSRITSFLPQIGQLDCSQEFKIHSIDGRIKRGIVNLNKKKIHNLSVSDLKQINQVFMKNADIMDFWGYEFYESSLSHISAHFRTSVELLARRMLYKVKVAAASTVGTSKSLLRSREHDEWSKTL